MSLDYSNGKLNRYFDALFVIGRMGDSKHELAMLQKVMSPSEYADLLLFDENHREVLEIVSRDEDENISKNELKQISNYEETADKINIAPRYKAKMYDIVLVGIDKFDRSNTHSLLLLGKMADNIAPGNRDDLQRLQKMSEAYKFGANALHERLGQKISLKLKGKNQKDVENSVARFKKISDELKNFHPTEEKIALLEEQLKLVDRCAFKKMKKFQTKAAICYDLSNEYASVKDIGKHDSYLNDSMYYRKLVKNIVEHIK